MTLLKRLLMATLVMLMLAGMACSKNKALYKQAAREYKKGEWEASLATNVQVLQQKSSNTKAQKLIKKTYSKLLTEGEERLKKLSSKPPDDALDKKVREYTQLLAYQNLVKPINPLTNPKTGEKYEFEFRDYEDMLAKSKLDAAEHHYQQGVRILAVNESPDSHRKALLEFQAALDYIPSYRDAAQLFTRSRELSTKRIAVGIFEDKSGTRSKYGSLIDLLTDTIISRLVKDTTIREYWDIVSRDNITDLLTEQQYGDAPSADNSTELGRFLGAHEILTGKIIQVNYVPERTSEFEMKETKNMVTGTETYTTDKGKVREREVKGDVSCVYTKSTKTASVRITAAYSLIDVSTGVMQDKDTVTAEYVWTDVWGRVTSGDERVLSGEALSLIRKAEPFPPAEADMVNSAMDKISDEILVRLRNHVLK